MCFPCPGGNQCGCQLPFFGTGYRKMMVNGLREWAALAGFALKVLTRTSPDHWSQSKSQISQSPDMPKLKLLCMRPGPDINMNTEMPVISCLHKAVGLVCGTFGALHIRHILSPCLFVHPCGRSTSASLARAPGPGSRQLCEQPHQPGGMH